MIASSQKETTAFGIGKRQWMRPFNYKALYKQLLTPDIVRLLTQIHEQKGRQDMFIGAHGDMLVELRKTAKYQSTEASNRIEGIITTDDRLKRLVRNKTTPRNRGEREIAGYRDALTAVHENHDYIPVRPGAILQLHRDLYRFSSASVGGSFKTGDNVIAEELPDGTSRLCFDPVPARETPEAMENLCGAFADAVNDPEIDPLPLIPVFILDFLCIHPFSDGNGRMSRLLTLLLLCRAGYVVGKYVSLEKLIADSRESCREALRESSAGWHEAENGPLPFVRYMLGIVEAAYREFFPRAETLAARGFSKPERVREIIRLTTGRITKARIMAECPDISQITVERALRDLLCGGEIIKIGGGRYTSYTWNWEADHT